MLFSLETKMPMLELWQIESRSSECCNHAATAQLMSAAIILIGWKRVSGCSDTDLPTEVTSNTGTKGINIRSSYYHWRLCFVKHLSVLVAIK